MPQYIALRDTLLAHESRIVKEGETFTTDFPEVNGKPIVLGSNIKLIEPAKAAPAAKGQKADDLV